MGAMFDWRREAITADPKYYRWTQWFFIQLFKHGLAYRKYSPVDWCPTCNTTLAREQVWGDDRHCERCHTPVIKKDLEQWFFKITDYAEQLLNYDTIDWPERVRTLQTNWIGKSEGAKVTFHTEKGEAFEIFTTRPDTLWGVSFHGSCTGTPTGARRSPRRSKKLRLKHTARQLPVSRIFKARQLIRKRRVFLLALMPSIR